MSRPRHYYKDPPPRVATIETDHHEIDMDDDGEPQRDLDKLTADEEDLYTQITEIADAARDPDPPPPAVNTRPILPKTRVKLSDLTTRARVIRCLIGYFSGGSVPLLMIANKISWGDIQIARLSDKKFDSAWKYAEKSRAELLALKAQARGEAALEGADMGKGEAQLIKFFLERVKSGIYGDPRYLHGPKEASNGGVTYQITINQSAAAQQPTPPPIIPTVKASPTPLSPLCDICVTSDDSKS